MSAEKTSTTTSWIVFVISTAVMIAMLIFMPQWFWLVLPFSLTSLVQALRVM